MGGLDLGFRVGFRALVLGGLGAGSLGYSTGFVLGRCRLGVSEDLQLRVEGSGPNPKSPKPQHGRELPPNIVP